MDVSVSPAQANQTPGIHTNDDTPGPAAFGPSWWGGHGHNGHHGVPYDPTHWAVAETSRASSVNQSSHLANAHAICALEGRITATLREGLDAAEGRLASHDTETRALVSAGEARLGAGQVEIRQLLRDLDTKSEIRFSEQRTSAQMLHKEVLDNKCLIEKSASELKCDMERISKESEISRLKDQLDECNKALLSIQIGGGNGGALARA